MSGWNCLAEQLGVEYLTSESHDTGTTPQYVASVSSEACSRLPDELKQALKLAVLELDVQQINELAAEISEIDEGLAKQIRNALEHLDIAAIQKALSV
ncbi:MAG: hypothetical protein ABW162_12425 [Candidatus Sedimenticola sp. PURPLELP]